MVGGGTIRYQPTSASAAAWWGCMMESYQTGTGPDNPRATRKASY